MFASIISGALISLLLFYLAPLPLMVAAMGWGPLSASIGGIAAAIGLGAIFGLPYCIAFVVMVALPAWWLGHLALLGRPIAPASPHGQWRRAGRAGDLEWYPVGRILLWISASVALTTMAALLTLGTDAATITGTMRRGLLRIFDLTDALSNGRNRTMDHGAGGDRAGRRRGRRDDDADAQPLARGKNHGDFGTAASSLARPEKRRTAADDAGRRCASRSRSASPADCWRSWRRSSPPP